MVSSLVDRATSDMLIGPDWAMNIEICDMLNHDPGLAKDVVKAIKKRIGSKNSKVQLLALTLLETIVKNCGDIVHMHVAQKEVLHEMVKIVKKKPNFHVKEKILILIDTWQEAFGGPRARYPQYYAAYLELLRAGAVFPQRTERSAPLFTPSQTHPLGSYSQNVRNSDDRADTSSEAEYPTLSLTEIQNARGIMDVLAEMLNAIGPENKEGLKQEIIVDLVEQCRTYKQRVVHLVNSTSDESLLCQGLALNDDLQRLLAKHQALASTEPVKSKPESAQDLVDVEAALVDTGERSRQADGSTVGQPSKAPLPASNPGTSTSKDLAKIDLLSGDLLSGKDLDALEPQSSLALVLVSVPQPSSPVASDQNALALVDMFSVGTSAPTFLNAQPEFQQQQLMQSPHPSPYQNGFATNMGFPYEQTGYQPPSSPSWNTHVIQPQQPSSPVYSVQQPSSPSYGAQNGGALPPPPWESQPDSPQFASQYSGQMQVATMASPQSPRIGHQMMGGNQQVVGMYMQPVTAAQLSMISNIQANQMPGMYPRAIQGGQMMGMLPQAMQMQMQMQAAPMHPSSMYGNQMAGYGGGYGYGNGYAQQQDFQLLENGMYGLSVRDDSKVRNDSYESSMLSYLPPMKQTPKTEDKLFGDLVDMARSKPLKSGPDRTGSA